METIKAAFSDVVVDVRNLRLGFPTHLSNALGDMNVPFDQGDSQLIVSGTNAIDLIGMMNMRQDPRFKEFFECNVGGQVLCKVKRTDDDSVIPFKPRESDVGYDLTLIKKHKVISSVCTLYDTGVQIEVPHGYYCEVVPRSSIIKSGHMMANSIGIIDRSYRGNIYVALLKVDASAPDIELPYRGFQLILRPQVHGVFQESNVDTTVRGSGGFGSSG